MVVQFWSPPEPSPVKPGKRADPGVQGHGVSHPTRCTAPCPLLASIAPYQEAETRAQLEGVACMSAYGTNLSDNAQVLQVPLMPVTPSRCCLWAMVRGNGVMAPLNV